MSLRNQTRVSPENLEANRANAQKSTGPRTRQGKARVAANALKHGLTAGAGSHLMRMLGEDPAEFDALHQALLDDWQPAGQTGRQVVMQLAELMWKRQRLARAEQALAARQADELECRRARLLSAVGQERLRASHAEVLVLGLWWLEDSPGKFDALLARLELLREYVRRGHFSAAGELALKEVYGSRPTLRGTTIEYLFDRFAHRHLPQPPAGFGAGPAHPPPAAGRAAPPSPSGPPPAPAGPGTPAIADAPAEEPAAQPGPSHEESNYSSLLDQIEQEIRQVRQEYRLYRRSQIEITPALRESQLAPSAPEWPLLIRQVNSTLRQIGQTIKLLLALQEAEREAAGESPPRAGPRPLTRSRPVGPPPHPAGGSRRPAWGAKAAAKAGGERFAPAGPRASRRRGVSPPTSARATSIAQTRKMQNKAGMSFRINPAGSLKATGNRPEGRPPDRSEG